MSGQGRPSGGGRCMPQMNAKTFCSRFSAYTLLRLNIQYLEWTKELLNVFEWDRAICSIIFTFSYRPRSAQTIVIRRHSKITSVNSKTTLSAYRGFLSRCQTLHATRQANSFNLLAKHKNAYRTIYLKYNDSLQKMTFVTSLEALCFCNGLLICLRAGIVKHYEWIFMTVYANIWQLHGTRTNATESVSPEFRLLPRGHLCEWFSRLTITAKPRTVRWPRWQQWLQEYMSTISLTRQHTNLYTLSVPRGNAKSHPLMGDWLCDTLGVSLFQRLS